MEQGLDTMPSDSICYPSKLAHGHVIDLVQQGVKTIFYPCVPFEQKEFDDVDDNFNCPIVASYPELIRNNIDLLREKKVTLLEPFLSLEDRKKLVKRLAGLFAPLGVPSAEIPQALDEGWAEQDRFRDDMQRKGLETIEYLARTGKRGIVLAGRPYHVDPEIHHGIPQIITSLGMAVLTEDAVAHRGKLAELLRVVDQLTYHARLYRAAAFVAASEKMEVIHLNSFGCGLDSVVVDQVQELIERQGKIYTSIKIDEGNNLGAARIRIRSLKAALEESNISGSSPVSTSLPTFKPAAFTRSMQSGHTIIAPQMSPMHFQFFEAAAEAVGYRLKILETVTPSTIDEGLRYVNNDACYPAIIVVGQIIEALKSGEYDPEKTAVMISQTGGGCRATNYIAYLRKALSDSGFSHIPVVSFNAVGMEKGDGFRLTLPLIHRLMMGVVYGDLLMQTLYRTRPYEKVAGSAEALYQQWVERCRKAILRGDLKTFRHNVYALVAEFDALELVEVRKPRVGLVGEILVKFHPTANNDLARTIEKEGGEAVVPGLMEFLYFCAYDNEYSRTPVQGQAGGPCGQRCHQSHGALSQGRPQGSGEKPPLPRSLYH